MKSWQTPWPAAKASAPTVVDACRRGIEAQALRDRVHKRVNLIEGIGEVAGRPSANSRMAASGRVRGVSRR